MTKQEIEAKIADVQRQLKSTGITAKRHSELTKEYIALYRKKLDMEYKDA